MKTFKWIVSLPIKNFLRTLFAILMLAASDWTTHAAQSLALAWDAMGWKILLVMFIVFLVITGALVAKGLAMLKQGKLAFPETMKELRNDREMLL